MCTTVHCNQAVRNQPSPKAPGLRSRTTSLVMANRTGEASLTPPPLIINIMQGGWEERKVVVGGVERVVLSERGGGMSIPAEPHRLHPANGTCQANRNIWQRFQNKCRTARVAVSELTAQKLMTSPAPTKAPTILRKYSAPPTTDVPNYNGARNTKLHRQHATGPCQIGTG